MQCFYSWVRSKCFKSVLCVCVCVCVCVYVCLCICVCACVCVCVLLAVPYINITNWNSTIRIHNKQNYTNHSPFSRLTRHPISSSGNLKVRFGYPRIYLGLYLVKLKEQEHFRQIICVFKFKVQIVYFNIHITSFRFNDTQRYIACWKWGCLKYWLYDASPKITC